jgi:hypothetical protein
MRAAAKRVGAIGEIAARLKARYSKPMLLVMVCRGGCRITDFTDFTDPVIHTP